MSRRDYMSCSDIRPPPPIVYRTQENMENHHFFSSSKIKFRSTLPVHPSISHDRSSIILEPTVSNSITLSSCISLAMASESDREPVIQSSPKLQSYYQSLESRIEYGLLLGGTHHFVFYEKKKKNDTWWPFPISNISTFTSDPLTDLQFAFRRLGRDSLGMPVVPGMVC